MRNPFVRIVIPSCIIIILLGSIGFIIALKYRQPETLHGTEDFEGVVYKIKNFNISFKYYPEYKLKREYPNSACFVWEQKIVEDQHERKTISIICWSKERMVYEWFHETFQKDLPERKKALKNEIYIKGKIISASVLNKENCEAYEFCSVENGKYMQRVELFPYHLDCQTTFLFAHGKEDRQRVRNMIESIKVF
jgi:hypothetical protein